MIIGNPKLFAIESYISSFNKNSGIRGIGFFLIHILNKEYGVRKKDATALGCSFDEIENRIKMRNMHTAPFSNCEDPNIIAESFITALFGDEQEKDTYFGLTYSQFVNIIYDNKILWAPDGDEAFDDGSYVIQFDLSSKVRLISFKNTGDGSYDRNTLCDLWLDSDEYYSTLKEWYNTFEAEWLDNIKKM